MRVLFVGGDFKRKGGPQLVEALGRLPAGAWTLDVVSYRRADGPPIPGARLIRWLPPRSPEHLEVFAAADVPALPTLADTFGWVLVEAMAAGLPVVATRVAAQPDVVTDGATGLLVEPGDVAGLAAALGRLAADRELRLRMGAAARADALKRFDAAADYCRLLGVIKSVGRAQVPGAGTPVRR
jgi:glycosyltransferase involved in cell wall biosynthesis